MRGVLPKSETGVVALLRSAEFLRGMNDSRFVKARLPLQ
jgi:hypothetical protein